MKLNIRYLSQSDVIALGGTDMQAAISDMERVLSLKETGDAIVPDKVSMGWGKTVLEEKTLGRINAMPGYIGGEYRMAGIKWIGSNPGNLNEGLPRASAVTILNDPVTKYPASIMDGTLISLTRTGAASGVAVKYLSSETSRTLVLIGAGLQCTAQLEATLCVRPEIHEIVISDLNFERARDFAADMEAKFRRNVTPVENALEYARRADIIITATGASSPVITSEWLNPEGCLYINLGGYECSYDTVEKADKIVVDSWSHVKHRRAGTIARMAEEGLVDDARIHANLGEIVLGRKTGRTASSEIIYYNGVGMGIEDVAVATRVYRNAEEKGVGKVLPFWD